MPIISLNKIAHPSKKITVLVLVAISVIALFLLLYFNIFAQVCPVPSQSSPDNPCVNPVTEFTLCPVLVSQPACYIENSPSPTLPWTFTTGPPLFGSVQIAYWVQVDNNDEPFGDFPSPEVNTAAVSSADRFYTVPLGRLQFNTTYYWKLATKDNHDTWSGWTCGDAFTTVNRCPPLQPTSLMATLITCSQIDLSWDNAANEDGYRLERKRGAGGIWAQIYDTGAADVTNYSDTNVAEGNTYYYRVLAYNVGGDSPYSNEASLAIPLCIPAAFNLGVTGGDATTYCTLPARHYFFWTYTDNSVNGLIDGDKQSKLQLQIDNNSDFSVPEFDSGPIITDAYACPNPTCDNDNSLVVIVVCDPVLNMLDYNTAYYWQVKVWDDDGLDSGWIPYDPDNDGSPDTFTTEMHRYPSPDFIWSPQEPSANETILFTDQSACYEVIGCRNPIPCTGSWSWTFEDGDPATSIEQNPITIFSSEGVKQTTLEVIDADGYGPCLVASSTNIGTALPGWKEILPW